MEADAQVSDPDAFISASFERSDGAPLPVDYDHALIAAQDKRTPAPAAGWITQMASRQDGIWGLIEWTPRAAKQVEAREYRFISPVFMNKPDGEAVLALSAGLTNQPALNLTAICSMERTRVSPDLEDFCAQIRPILGLDTDVEPDAIIEAVRGMSSRATAASVAPPVDKFVPIAEFEKVVAAFNSQNRGVSVAAAELAVGREIEAGRLIPSLKGWAVTLCSENKPAFEAFVQRTSGHLQGLFSRTASGLPNDSKSVTGLDLEIAQRMGLSASDFK